MRRYFRVAILALPLGLDAAFSYASDFTKLAPEPVVVHLENGHGSEKVVFFRAKGTSVNKVLATHASGKNASISEKDIQATIETTEDPSLLTVVLQVTTQQFIERGVPYKGTLLLFKQAEAPPEQFPFSIEDDNLISFDSLQASLDVATGFLQPPRYQIRIRNNGKTRIEDLSISSSNLTDTGTGKRANLSAQSPDWGESAIEPDDERVVSFELPQPVRAGTFVGQIYLTANHQKTISIPFTLRSRGPWGKWGIPFAAFCIIIIAGIAISNKLDAWFSGGGLVRAQAYLSLRSSQSTLVQRYSDLQNWHSDVPVIQPAIAVPHIDLWLREAIQELESELKVIDTVPQDLLISDVQRYVLATGTINLFWSAVQSATSKWSDRPDKLQQIIAAMDNAQRPSSGAELDAYRVALLGTVPADLSAGDGPGIRVMTASSQWDPAAVKGKIEGMSRLYQLVVWAVVILTAYLSFYAHNLAFGNLSDYMVLFAWALGLTQTGSQIVARAHK